MRFSEMGAREIAAGVREKKFSAAEVFEDCLGRAVECEDKLSALMTVSAEAGRTRAKRIDEMTARGEEAGLLAGVPVVLKDNICTSGIRTAAGSYVLGDWAPPYDAAAWSLLAGQGAVLLGKADMDEFGMGNYDGGAAAVAAGYVPFSLGSGTGGSICLTASYRGIYGFKPSYGLVSRSGLVACVSSLDRIGPFTRSVEDIALVMQVIARHDSKDSTSVSKSEINFTKRTGTLKGRKIALVKDFMDITLDQPTADAMKRTVRLFEESGAEIAEVALPTAARYAVACYCTIMALEAYTNFARFDGVRCGRTATGGGFSSARDMFEAARSEGFGKEVKSAIITGACLTEPGRYEEYYAAAARVRTLIAEELHKAFAEGGIDCILQPVAPSLPGKTAKKYEPDLYNAPAGLAGLPGFSFRAGTGGLPSAPTDDFPVGLQIIGPRWSDGELLDIGFELEKILGAPKIAPGPQR